MTSLPQQYYSRLQGQWSWNLVIEIRNWKEICRHPFTGIQIFLMTLWQRLAGPLHFWTEVDLVSDQCVSHKTYISKWGMTLFKSTETIEFDQANVVVFGKQSFWPLLFWQKQLGPFDGKIVNPMKAEYQFEILGFPCLFKSDFNVGAGFLLFEGAAIGGRVELLPECKARLT